MRNRDSAYRALFGSDPKAASQEDAQLLLDTGGMTPTDDDTLEDDVRSQVDLFESDPVVYAEMEHEGRKQILTWLAAKLRPPVVAFKEEDEPTERNEDEEDFGGGTTERPSAVPRTRLAQTGRNARNQPEEREHGRVRETRREERLGPAPPSYVRSTSTDPNTVGGWPRIRAQLEKLFAEYEGGDAGARERIHALRSEIPSWMKASKLAYHYILMRKLDPTCVNDPAFIEQFGSTPSNPSSGS